MLNRLRALEGKLSAIAEAVPPPETASGTYSQAEMAAAFTSIRAIIEAAGQEIP